MSDITLMLQAVERGEKQTSEDLLPLVYAELRRVAAARMAQEAAGQTLQPTALVVNTNAFSVPIRTLDGGVFFRMIYNVTFL